MEERKKKSNLWVVILTMLLFVGILTGVYGVKMYKDNQITATPSNGEVVSILEGDIHSVVSSYTRGITDRYYTKTDCFAPKDVVITWDCMEDGATSYHLKIGTKEDLSDAKCYETTERSFSINHLYADTHYYYQIEAVWFNKTVKSKIFDFVTEKSVRTIAVEGVSNTRDIGGKITTSGKKVKQGMAFRGAYLDEIKPAGKVKALETYGIKTDLDLRKAQEGTAGSASPLGETVRYINYSCPYYWGGDSGINNPNNHENLANAIRVFADEANYPIFFHCSVGRDRTSMVAMLIEGILGVSEDDVFIDYETSAFSYRGTLDGTSMSHMVNTFMNTVSSLWVYTGERELQAACETFLLSIGVTQAEIDSIRSILLED